MRSMMASLIIVGLLAAPSLAEVDVQIVPADTQIQMNGQTTVTVQVRTGVGGVGVYSLGGDILASGTGGLQAMAGSFTFDSEYLGSDLFAPIEGAAGANGGWAGFGSVRTGSLLIDGHGDSSWVDFATYTIEGTSLGDVTLAFSSRKIGGWMPLDTNEAGMGTSASATITVVPEPATLAMLALGGMVLIRRRR